jgi:PKD repeat protein
MPTSPRSAPTPVADFCFSPPDPSIGESVQFIDRSYDPADAGIATIVWDLGDGAIAIGSSPSHRYAADGEYRATLTVTSADGRSASIAQIVSVRTHGVW